MIYLHNTFKRFASNITTGTSTSLPKSLIIMDSTISLQNKTLDTKLKTIYTQSLTWHIGKTCEFMHSFTSLHSDPILLWEHPPLCQRKFYYHVFNNIITKQDSWHKTENKTQSLTWHIGKTCTFMHNFISLHFKLLNSWALQLPAFMLSSWAIDATKEQSGCTCTCEQKKESKKTHELLDSSMPQLLLLLLPDPLQACYSFCFLNIPAMLQRSRHTVSFGCPSLISGL
jgi:hypothetical protein